jgi:hypothetical protein
MPEILTRWSKRHQLDALASLVECDHGYLTPQGVRDFCAPFGIDPATVMQRQQNAPSAFKGLDCPGVPDGEPVEGCDAADLAEIIAATLIPGWHSIMQGRGSRLRWACQAAREAVIAHFGGVEG